MEIKKKNGSFSCQVTYLPLSHSAAQMIDVWMMMTAGNCSIHIYVLVILLFYKLVTL